MYRVLLDRAWWPAVGAPLEQGVRLYSLVDSEGSPHVNAAVFIFSMHGKAR